MKDIYSPIHKKVKFDGFAGNNAVGGEYVDVISKAFITSDESMFETLANQIVNLTIGHSHDSVNKLLVIIKPDYSAKIYTDYPLSVNVRIKRPIKAGQVVYDSDIADIESVVFEDDTEFTFDFEKGDRIIWIFRIRWKFGLYINMTNEYDYSEVMKELGDVYKLLRYYDLYEFIEDSKQLELLINDGWFPFVELMSSKYRRLLDYYNDEDQFVYRINSIVDEYDAKRIEQLSMKWWRFKLFADKQEIIQAGLDAFNSGTTGGYINCIKNLATELEGIIRTDYVNQEQKKPHTKDLKNYVVKKGKDKVNSELSMLFPQLFEKYLDEVLFKGFDMLNGKLPDSRHVYAHGVASKSQYSKIKALQIILSIDQLFYYLM